MRKEFLTFGSLNIEQEEIDEVVDVINAVTKVLTHYKSDLL